MKATKFDGITIIFYCTSVWLVYVHFFIFHYYIFRFQPFFFNLGVRIVVEPNQLITRERDKNICSLAAAECSIIICVMCCRLSDHVKYTVDIELWWLLKGSNNKHTWNNLLSLFLSFYFFVWITSQNGVDKLLYNRIDRAYKVRNKSATFFWQFFDCLFFCLFGFDILQLLTDMLCHTSIILSLFKTVVISICVFRMPK